MPFSFSGHVVGSWVDFSGRPNTGYIVLEAPLSLSSYFDNESNAGMVGRLIRIPLEDGKIDRFVPATDDPDIEPTDWTYKVTYYFNGSPFESFYISVPSDVVTDIPTAVHEIIIGPPPPPDASTQILNLLKEYVDNDPDFVGPPGAASVVPGPPNVLVKGVVTTGLPGTDADITISGTSPEQILDITIPRGNPGDKGDDGDTAYEVAVINGFVGTVNEWLASLSGNDGNDGDDAYEVAVSQGFVGDRTAWLESLVGPSGSSAYAVAVAQGFVGNEAAWLASLVGSDGNDGNDGNDGDNAYEVAVINGFVGTEVEWLASLVGPEGDLGPVRPKDEIRSDVSGNFNYIGVAPLNSTEGAAVWTITRINLTAPIGVSAVAVDEAWDDRLSAVYV